jgi:hypothetical protein
MLRLPYNYDEPSLIVGLLPRYREVVVTASKLVLSFSRHSLHKQSLYFERRSVLV